jgi:hypothetical protein
MEERAGMNSNERKMLDLLVKGRDEYGWVAAKAEFEAEGTRLDELLRLVEIVRRSGLKLAVKIGGCEALMDLYQAKLVGADYIVGPMIESGYALSKYRDAITKAYSPEEQEDCSFLWNLETTQSYKNLGDMLSIANEDNILTGIVFGRSDYTGSLGLSGDEVNSMRILSDVCNVADSCLRGGLELVVGGGVSIDSAEFLLSVSEIKLSRFETRKVIFDSAALSKPTLKDGMLDALRFELLWLSNKNDYYSGIVREDEKRFTTLKKRWNLD